MSESKALERLRALMLRNNGLYYSDCVYWSHKFSPLDPSSLAGWTKSTMEVTPKGELILDSSLVMISLLQRCQLQLFQADFVIKIISNRTVFIKVQRYKEYETLLSCLVIWQKLKPAGLGNKWNFNKSIVYNSKLRSNDLLVCRFRIYGPTPTSKKVRVSNDPENPIYPSDGSSGPEGWFIAMGYLKPNGVLDLLRESDGSLFYSLDVTKLYSSEIRHVHHSLFENSNILFLGYVGDLRRQHASGVDVDTSDAESLIIGGDGKKTPRARRVLIDFDLRIDLEDWLVTLRSFTKLEFIGNGIVQQKMRVVKNYKLEIIEAKLTTATADLEHVYCELSIWNAPWFRTAIVDNTDCNPFWKEIFSLDLPPTSEFLKLLIRSANNGDFYNNGENDDIVGAVFITPDNMTESQMLKKLTIYGNNSQEIGHLTINLDLQESHILPFQNYKIFEKMMVSLDIDNLISFFDPLITPTNLEKWSYVLLDIYHSLGREDAFFDSLMKSELEPINTMTTNNRITKSNSKNGLNTLFRGASILSKSLEKYQQRVGQEYLEKVLGEFVSIITDRDLDCDCDPKHCPDTYKENYKNLLGYIELLWEKIFTTSNDVPAELKKQWAKLRDRVELSVEPSDKETPLNALGSFVFLRFMCPAILNPKMFNLTKNHQSGKISKTLTLIAKILMIFSNRSKFQPHKDPYLLNMNTDFLEKHSEEMLIYLDRITGRKLDFTEKILDMSNLVERPSLNVSDEVLNELPTMPFLIDKYLRLVELIELLDSKNSPESKSELEINNRNATITDLKFDILGFDDTDLGSEEFIKALLDDDDDEFNQLILKQPSISIKELMQQASILVKKTQKLEKVLNKPEKPSIYTHESWIIFVDSILRSIQIDNDGFVVYDLAILGQDGKKGGKDSGVDAFMRTLINKNEIVKSESIQSMIYAQSQTSNGNGSSKNVFKKLFGKKKIVS